MYLRMEPAKVQRKAEPREKWGCDDILLEFSQTQVSLWIASYLSQ